MSHALDVSKSLKGSTNFTTSKLNLMSKGTSNRHSMATIQASIHKTPYRENKNREFKSSASRNFNAERENSAERLDEWNQIFSL